MPKFIDLKGQFFNRLEVIEKDEEASKKHGRPYWLCRCSCGKEKTIAGLSLRNKSTQSCGCLRNEKVFEAVSKDEKGNRYGKLLVKEIDNERDNKGSIKWICECECGNIVSVAGSDLRSHNTQSCGCTNGISRGEQKIIDILDACNIPYAREYKVPELGNKRFDFAIFDNNTISRLIEFDGEQHYKEGLWGKVCLNRTHESDLLKNNYAKTKSIPMVRIPYWQLNNLTLELLMSDKYLIN